MAGVGGTVGVATGDVAAQATNGTNVTQHEKPETVAEQGDTTRLRGWLSGRLVDRLRENSIRLSRGQYETADDVFGEEFERRLGQYVDVAGETDGGPTAGGEGDESDTEGTAFDRARDNQRDLVSQRRAYEETYTAYRQAREQGETGAVRQHARRLQQLASGIEQRGTNATRSLRAIENRTGADTSDIERRIEREVRNVTALQEEVRTETFLETALTVTTNRSVASFVDPVGVRGRLVTENGTAVANRSIRVQVGRRVIESTTGPDGTFAVTYRPVLVPADAETVPVRYIPNTTSPYLGTATNASLEIEQVTPTLEVSVEPKRAGIGDGLAVEAVLSVDGRPVPGVPVGARLAGRALGETPTDSEGTARVEGAVPVGIALSDSSVRAVVGPQNRAIGPANASTELTLREAPTDLSIRARGTSQGIRIRGRLVGVTEDGETLGAPSQPVVVSVGGSTRTVRTDSQGRYETTVAPEAVAGTTASEPTPIRVRFDGSGTNLESASAETRLNVSAMGGGPDRASGGTGRASGETGRASGGTETLLPGGVPLVVVVVFLLLFLLLLGGGVFNGLWGRRTDDEDATAVDDQVTLAEDTADGSQPSETELDEAREALARGATDDAVVSAYAAVRASLTDRFDVGGTHTPRELLAACDHHLDREAHRALQRLTTAYERAVFAPDGVDAGGQDAVDAARSLLATGPSRSDDPADD